MLYYGNVFWMLLALCLAVGAPCVCMGLLCGYYHCCVVGSRASAASADVTVVVIAPSDICAICADSDARAELEPCRHRVCAACADRLRRCPFCRAHLDPHQRRPLEIIH